MSIDAIVLAVAAVVFCGVGAQGLFLPHRIINPLEQKLESVPLKNEIRANYGGMHFAMAALMVVAILKPVYLSAGMALLFAFTTGLVVGRIYSMIADGIPNRFVRFFTGVEAVGAIAAGILLFRS